MAAYEEQDDENQQNHPFYDGLFMQKGELYARTGCVYKGKRITADNTLRGTLAMVSFEIEHMPEELNKETEIRPLVDLAFATIAFTFGPEGALTQDGATKTREAFLAEGLTRLEEMEMIPPVPEPIKTIFEDNKDLWPQEILPLIQTFQKGSNSLSRFRKAERLEK